MDYPNFKGRPVAFEGVARKDVTNDYYPLLRPALYLLGSGN